jgi:Fur family ferric uptake transcriptional regulator
MFESGARGDTLCAEMREAKPRALGDGRDPSRGGSPRDVDGLAATLRRSGLKKTAPRVAVLQSLEREVTPRTHGEIAEELAALGFDQATIYRNLMDLVEANLVSRSDLGDHVWRYEIRRGGDGHVSEHPHFLCVDCGGVTCLPGGAVRLVSLRGVPRAVVSRAVEVQVKGLCDACGK